MKIPSYYAAQETAYQVIRKKGEAGWLRKTFDEFRDAETDALLQSYVSTHFPDTKGLTALDLGTGTGSTAHTLHDLGFHVTGVDVCPSAIELAREIATTHMKDIRFEVADVLALKEQFDLIYDSHCIHCVVFEEDRDSLFKAIHKSLQPNGLFILDTMVFHETDVSWKKIETLRLDDEYILWHKTLSESHTGVVKIEGTYWCPQRRIYPVEKILSELEAQNFHVLSSAVKNGIEDGAFMFRAMCVKAP
jgi:2-polyprenyl-3-methyl-5-hydroxy-6-metoxy-1,4-benzoquinol methylase